MSNSSGDAHEYPIYGAHFRITFPIFDADGDFVTGATGLDSEVSLDGGTFSDCTNEATEIASSSGVYYLDLTGAEMSAKTVAVQIKTSTSGAKTTPIILYPRRLASIESGTATAGGNTTITVAANNVLTDGALNGCLVLITNNSPSGAQYQLRRIISSIASTQVLTVDSAWGTNPNSSSTYNILAPDTVNVASWIGVVIDAIDANIVAVNGETATTPTVVDANVTEWQGVPVNSTDSAGNIPVVVTGIDVLPATVSAIIDGVWDEPQSLHHNSGTFGKYLDAAISGVSTGGVSASDIATAVWDTSRASHTTSGTFGQGAASVQGSVTGSVASVSGAVNSVTGNIGGNLVGTIGGLSTQAKTDVKGQSDQSLTDYGPLKPSTAGRTLDVSLTGEAGLDFNNIKDSSSSHRLTNIVIDGNVISWDDILVPAPDSSGNITVNANITSWEGMPVAPADSSGNIPASIGGLGSDIVTDIVHGVWNEHQSSHTAAGTFGKYLDASISGVSTGGVSASDIATAVWDTSRASHTTSGTFGEANDVPISTRLAPTAAGRTLDVSVGGEAGIDWSNIGSPTTTIGLSGTTVKTATDVESKLPSALIGGRMDSSVGAMATDVITASALATSAANEIAQTLLTIDFASISGESARSVLNALRKLMNKIEVLGSTLTIYKENDTTPAWTQTLSTDGSASPITGADTN